MTSIPSVAALAAGGAALAGGTVAGLAAHGRDSDARASAKRDTGDIDSMLPLAGLLSLGCTGIGAGSILTRGSGLAGVGHVAGGMAFAAAGAAGLAVTAAGLLDGD